MTRTKGDADEYGIKRAWFSELARDFGHRWYKR